jgi:peptide/nickel transport system ATP-binding protein
MASAPGITTATPAAVEAEPPLLEVTGLCTYFFTADGVVRAVDDLSLAIKPGEILGIVGESGSGKSMTGLSILRLVDEPGRVVAGSIRFRGEDLAKLSPAGIRAVRGAGIGMVFQDPMTSLNPVKRVAAQIMEAIRAHRPVDKPEARGRAVALLKRMGVPAPDRAVQAFPHQFSGGMRQRVVMAIGSANQPDLLIADEPTTALDVTVQREILALLRELANEANTAIMLITHNLGVVAATCDRVAVMYAGEIVEAGPAETVLSHASHPYTQSLLNAVPRLDRPAKSARPIRRSRPSRVATNRAAGWRRPARRRGGRARPSPPRHKRPKRGARARRCWSRSTSPRNSASAAASGAARSASSPSMTSASRSRTRARSASSANRAAASPPSRAS